MAARLTIDSIFQKRFQQYMPKVNEWAGRRDVLEREGMGQAAEAAQECVDYYFAKLYEQGYFGDNYQHNLLDQFCLCWTKDIYFGLLGERHRITPSDAVKFLHILQDREPQFRRNTRNVKLVDGMTRAETTYYYCDKYKRLMALLKQAVDRNEPIAFSC